MVARLIRSAMIVPCWILAVVLALLSARAVAGSSARSSQSSGPAADIILYNGKVWTVDSKQPVAEAVAVRGPKIVRVGSDRQVLALKGAGSRVIDLKGRLVLPGFNDAHTHFENAVRSFFQVRLIDVNEPLEFARRLQAAVQRVPKGRWITGVNWAGLAGWAAEKRGDSAFKPFVPDLATVDAIAPDSPLLLRRYDHVYFANSRALQLARITRRTHDPLGGHFDRNPATGELTGLLFGTAGEQVAALVPPFTEADGLIGARGVLRELNRYGITSIQDIARLNAISERQHFPTYTERSYSDSQIFRDLRSANQLTVRVYAFMPLQTWRELKDFGISPGAGDDMIRYGILKDFTDGTLMFEPYASDPNFSGDWTFRFPGEEVMARNIREADRARFDVGLHIIGDKALHSALEWYEAAMKRNGPRDRRLRLIHVWFAREDDLKRAGQLGLIADVTPMQLLDDPDKIEKVAGPERAKTAFAWRTMIDDGIRLDLVSDLPGSFNDLQVSPFNPLENIYSAVTRNARSGRPWHPEQCITLQEAIMAYTANPAFASHEEKLKGTITPGKLADLVVLSRDILTAPPDELRSTEVWYTILGGKFVYERSSANETSGSKDVTPAFIPQPDSASAAPYRSRL